MSVSGKMLIGGQAVFGSQGRLQGVDAVSGEALQPAFGGASGADLQRACALAEAAFDPYRQLPLAQRADFLLSIAQHILQLGDELIERCQLETGLPRALEERAEAIAQAFVASLTLGAGQFCTNPGLLLAVEGPALQRFESAAAAALGKVAAQTMLTSGIGRSYEQGVAALVAHPQVETLARGLAGTGMQARGALFATTAAAFMADRGLHEEVFGAAALIVRCPDTATLEQLLRGLEGQLTLALHLGDGDLPLARQLLPLLESKAGRLLVNGFGTGVEVAHAMVHGGPFPASSDSRSTSVGSLAIQRFLRPVCYQDLPEALLPEELRDDNPLHIAQTIDGQGPG